MNVNRISRKPSSKLASWHRLGRAEIRFRARDALAWCFGAFSDSLATASPAHEQSPWGEEAGRCCGKKWVVQSQFWSPFWGNLLPHHAAQREAWWATAARVDWQREWPKIFFFFFRKYRLEASNLPAFFFFLPRSRRYRLARWEM